MKVTPWLVLLSLSLISCSGSKSAQKVNEESPQIELSDADEFIETPADDQVVADASVDPSSEPIVEDPAAAPVEEPVVSDIDDSTVEEIPVAAAPEISTEAPVEAPRQSTFQAGAQSQYRVQKNETLMMIAFKLYGDYGMWKQLANQNQNVLKGSTLVQEGMTLSYVAPSQEFVWNPQGLPYLIRGGDTLGTISQTVYTTPKKWKLIWDNNRPLIKDPNKIFAGFTIYYLESGREVASEI